jgi:hypothetical protein
METADWRIIKMKSVNLATIKPHEFRVKHEYCWCRSYLYTFPVDWNIHSKYGSLLTSVKDKIQFKILHIGLRVPI